MSDARLVKGSWIEQRYKQETPVPLNVGQGPHQLSLCVPTRRFFEVRALRLPAIASLMLPAYATKTGDARPVVGVLVETDSAAKRKWIVAVP